MLQVLFRFEKRLLQPLAKHFTLIAVEVVEPQNGFLSHLFFLATGPPVLCEGILATHNKHFRDAVPDCGGTSVQEG